jgi:hypothetical protein
LDSKSAAEIAASLADALEELHWLKRSHDRRKARVIAKTPYSRPRTGCIGPGPQRRQGSVNGHKFQQVGFSIEASTSRQSTTPEGQEIGDPASVPSRVKVKR